MKTMRQQRRRNRRDDGRRRVPCRSRRGVGPSNDKFVVRFVAVAFVVAATFGAAPAVTSFSGDSSSFPGAETDGPDGAVSSSTPYRRRQSERRSQQQGGEQPQGMLRHGHRAPAQEDDHDRRLEEDRVFDFFFPTDVCKNGEDEYGVCDQDRFPKCKDGKELICYNRRPMQHRFYHDNRQPYFYIDYDNVYCYPDSWGGCSSCSPGRYCLSESRCILDENDYGCKKWI